MPQLTICTWKETPTWAEKKKSLAVNYLSRNKNIGLGKKYLSVFNSLLF
jgi:hypothetical protein